MLKTVLETLSYPTNLVKSPKYDDYMTKLETNRNKLLYWRKNREQYLPSILPLRSFIVSIPKGYSNDSDINYTFELLRKVGSFGMSSVYGLKDTIEMGIFNGRCRESWMVVSETMTGTGKNINDLKPIRCIWHPFDSLNFWLDEETTIKSKDVAFFVIDLSSLFQLISYHFKRDERFTVDRFIQKVLYPLILDDIINITMFNRYDRIHHNKIDIEEKPRKTPIWLDLNDTTLEFQETTLKLISDGDTSLNYIAQNLHLTKNETLYSLLSGFPYLFTTGHMKTLYFLAICKYIIFLFDFNLTHRGITDRQLISFIKNQLNIIENVSTNTVTVPILTEKRKKEFETLKLLLN